MKRSSEDTIVERDTLMAVLRLAIPQMTRRQLECLVLFSIGLTQTESGFVLGISHQMVHAHLRSAITKISNCGKLIGTS